MKMLDKLEFMIHYVLDDDMFVYYLKTVRGEANFVYASSEMWNTGDMRATPIEWAMYHLPKMLGDEQYWMNWVVAGMTSKKKKHPVDALYDKMEEQGMFN